MARLSTVDLRSYVEYFAVRRLERLDMPVVTARGARWRSWGSRTLPELPDAVERMTSAYQVGVSGSVGFEDDS